MLRLPAGGAPSLATWARPNALDRLPDLLRALNAEEVDYVLFGGQALNLHGIAARGVTGPRLGEADVFADIEAEWVDRCGMRAHVATARMLYRMKKDTMRPLDRADAADLKAKFHFEED
jgi:hypothetical protein